MSKGGIEEYAELELPIGVHSLHEYEPAAFAQILLDAIQGVSGPQEAAIKYHISDVVESIASVDLDYVTHTLYHFLSRISYQEVAKLMRGALTQPQCALVLAEMASFSDWRRLHVMDLMVELAKEWPLAPIKLMIAHIPRIAIDPTIHPGPLSAKYDPIYGDYNEDLIIRRDSEAPAIEASGKSGRRRIDPTKEISASSAPENEIISEDEDKELTQKDSETSIDAAREEKGVWQDEEYEVDYSHPTSFWGYKQKLEESVRSEAKRSRMTMDIVAPLGPDGSASLRTDEGECEPGVLLTLPYCAHNSEWFPDEIGVLIGRLFADEWELDFITLVLTDLATNFFSENAAQYRWEDYMGYVGTILASAMAVQRHWENEDVTWVYKDFCIDVGKWALYTWEDFREMEYRAWLADIIVMAANKRGLVTHDTKLIHALIQTVTEEWDYERRDYLGFMVEWRMNPRSRHFQALDQLKAILPFTESTLLSPAQHTRSLLWSPPSQYCYEDEWRNEHEKQLLLHSPEETGEERRRDEEL